VESAIAEFKKYKSPGSDQNLAGDETLWSEIHKLINSILNKGEFPDQWKESVIVPVHKKGDKSDCSNFCGISVLSTPYRILCNILYQG
jgi:hypothetical protein